MIRQTLGCLLTLATLSGVPCADANAQQLDQQVPGPRNYGFWFDRDVVRWQQFRPTLPVLERVDLQLLRWGYPGDVSVSVRNDSGNALWSGTIAQNSIPRHATSTGPGDWVSVTVPKLSLTPETPYRIYVSSSGASPDVDNRYFWDGVTNSPYNRGISGVESDWPNYDFCFKTWGSTGVSPQNIYLAWNQDLPVVIERKTNWRGESVYVKKSGSMTHATLSAGDRTDIQQRVAQMFADSGVTNIKFVSSPTDATTVYFAQTPTGDPSWTLLGKAYSGLDRYNKNRTGSVAVFATGTNEDDAETAAHEVGHTFGLRHVNPGPGADPGNLEVMDYDSQPLDRERFINTVSDITEPPTTGGAVQSKTHNPVYHLRRYVDGWSHDALIAGGVNDGTWDRSVWDRVTSKFSFTGNDRVLYDFNLMSGSDGETLDPIAHYDSIRLSELSQLAFELDADTPFECFASSAAGGTWDISLSSGDPFIPDNTSFMPTVGSISGYLQQITGLGTYAAVADVNVQMTPTPEPGSLVLCVWAVAARRRRFPRAQADS